MALGTSRQVLCRDPSSLVALGYLIRLVVMAGIASVIDVIIPMAGFTG